MIGFYRFGMVSIPFCLLQMTLTIVLVTDCEVLPQAANCFLEQEEAIVWQREEKSPICEKRGFGIQNATRGDLLENACHVVYEIYM